MATWQVWAGGALAVLVLMTATWVVSVVRRDASIVDRVWGLCFVAAVWTYVALGDGAPDRALLVAVLVTVWGVRLSVYITARNWGEGEDRRYVRMRERAGDGFPVTSLFRVFWLQAVIAWIVSLPLVAVAVAPSGAGLGWLDLIATLVWLLGFVFEAGGDLQLSRFLADPDNRGKVMDQGLWRYTRHPNYFGDTTVWWAYALFGIAAGAWWGILGAAVMTLFILKVSGVALTERGMSGSSKREGYDAYVARTNTFFPGPPKRV